MTLRYDDIVSRDGDTIDRDYLNRRWKLIAENIRSNAERIDGFADTEARLIELGLQRINEVLGPALQSVNAAVELGFLVQPSDTSVEMVEGVDVELTLADNAAKDIFAPTPFLAVMDVADEDNWAIVKRVSYNKTSGVLGVRPLFVSGSGAGNDWLIAASGPMLPIMETKLTETIAARDDAIAAAASATADKNTVAADKATVLAYRNASQSAASAAAADRAAVEQEAATLAGLIANMASGPVQSVNGKTGFAVLTASDLSAYTTAQVDEKLAVIDSGTF